ncbi:MAG: outer membrane protein OmpK [Motiliproteus sp.]
MKLRTLIALVFISVTAPNVHAEMLFSNASISYLKGDHYQLGDKQRQVITLEHASGFGWGDNFFFLDRLKNHNGQYSTYYELAPRLNLKTFGNLDLSFGPVSDVLLAATWESGSSSRRFDNYLYGIGFNLQAPGFKYLKLNFYLVDNELKPDDEQLTLSWAYPFSISNHTFLYDGFLDWSSSSDSHAAEMNFTSQIKWDIGKHLDMSHPLYAGFEYAYWNNKFGVKGANERNPSILLKLHF